MRPMMLGDLLHLKGKPAWNRAHHVGEENNNWGSLMGWVPAYDWHQYQKHLTHEFGLGPKPLSPLGESPEQTV